MKKNVLKIIAFLKKDVVLTAALLSGILSSIVCKQPIKEIISSIDFKVLSLLFCLMTVIAAFKSINVLDVFSQKLLQKCGTIRSVYFVLCALVFFSSAIVTNDVALLTFVPITLIVCKQAKIAPLKLIVLETLAANLGSCITPMGNPQNLFIYSFYKMSNADFFSTTLKIGIFSFFLLIPFIFF
ncbi:MAG: transporter [Treponema sp.]|nr:transporter [Treponema sp.]